jgi:hypothetical protein
LIELKFNPVYTISRGKIAKRDIVQLSTTKFSSLLVFSGGLGVFGGLHWHTVSGPMLKQGKQFRKIEQSKHGAPTAGSPLHMPLLPYG